MTLRKSDPNLETKTWKDSGEPVVLSPWQNPGIAALISVEESAAAKGRSTSKRPITTLLLGSLLSGLLLKGAVHILWGSPHIN